MTETTNHTNAPVPPWVAGGQHQPPAGGPVPVQTGGPTGPVGPNQGPYQVQQQAPEKAGGSRPSGLVLAGAGSLLAVLAFLGGTAVGHAWGGASGTTPTQGGPGGGFRQFPGQQGQVPGQGTVPQQGQQRTVPGQGQQGTVPGQGQPSTVPGQTRTS
jgi:hypothetical protein